MRDGTWLVIQCRLLSREFSRLLRRLAACYLREQGGRHTGTQVAEAFMFGAMQYWS